METAFGLRGTIVSTDPLRGKRELFRFEPFQLSVEDGVLEIGYEEEGLAGKAREVADQHLAGFSFEGPRGTPKTGQ